jgi:hypothetical protein
MKRLLVLLAIVPLTAQSLCLFKQDMFSGSNRICFYDCLGAPKVTVISAMSFCPYML